MEYERKKVWEKLQQEYDLQRSTVVSDGVWGFIKTMGAVLGPMVVTYAGLIIADRYGYSYGENEVAFFLGMGLISSAVSAKYVWRMSERKTTNSTRKISATYELKGFVPEDISEIIYKHVDFESDSEKLEDETPNIMYKYYGQYEQVLHLVVPSRYEQNDLASFAFKNRKQ